MGQATRTKTLCIREQSKPFLIYVGFSQVLCHSDEKLTNKEGDFP
jgi:hypothetical protein